MLTWLVEVWDWITSIRTGAQQARERHHNVMERTIAGQKAAMEAYEKQLDLVRPSAVLKEVQAHQALLEAQAAARLKEMAIQVDEMHARMLAQNTVAQLTNYGEEAPAMHVKIYDPSLTGWAAMPHQKLLIIDSLLAFKGSANLTLAGWQQAAQGRDVVEVVIDLDQVIEFNNRLFAPIWAELSDIGETISMAWRSITQYHG